MTEEPGDRMDLELATTALLAREDDLPMLLRMLARQLQGLLPEQVTVEREGGLFRKSDAVRTLEVAMGADTFRAEVVKGQVTATIGHTSGGIRIRSEKVEVDQWLRRLLDALQAEADRSQNARHALEQLLYGGY